MQHPPKIGGDHYYQMRNRHYYLAGNDLYCVSDTQKVITRKKGSDFFLQENWPIVTEGEELEHAKQKSRFIPPAVRT